MTYISWDTTFSIRVRELDEQHKRLINILNNILECLAEGSGQRTVAELFSSLAITLRSHFICEESLMRRYGYPGLHGHKREHDKLVEQIGITARTIATGNLLLARDVHAFIGTWWLDHIMRDDSQFGPFLVSMGHS